MTEPSIEETRELKPRYNEQGLIPAIVQDIETGQVLMMAWMNEQAFENTLQTRKATFFSRSRNKSWVKGESSGHIMEVVEARLDCDQDTLVLRCRAHGPACHAGYRSCFYRLIEDGGLRITDEKVFDPEKVYGG
ncbi:MAG: phosphoribosyl-AMP cyclohydrolase [Phycisphaeraceae bacterium]|nr:phosphoribosyl-AMP cyclohydrolase [Phycisphaeraceae bacterium]